MDETNTVQQVPGQLVDTGPQPFDVLQARMTLQEQELLDRMESLRDQLEHSASSAPPGRLAELTRTLVRVESRLDMVRQLRNPW